MIEIPGYKIIKELGKGGMAAVYLAVQQGLDREVALKIMSPALAADPSFGERFVREAKIVAQLSHPQIVTVYDVGQHERHNYIAMEYHNGGDLSHKIASGISVEEGIKVIAAVAKALSFAHKRGYIHRDVKPENILFKSNGEPVLSDFGIAKATNSNTQMTQSGSVIGTPRYMSPEQARGKNADGRADIYSLGVIFYEILTGKLPFDGEDSLSIGIKHITDPIPRLPSELKQYQAVVDKFMAKQPGNRYQTGDEAAEALMALLSGFSENDATQMFDAQPIESTVVMESIARTQVHNKNSKTDPKLAKQDKPGSKKGIVVSLIATLIIAGSAGAYFYPDLLPMQASEWVKVSLKGEASYDERQAAAQRENKIKSLANKLEVFNAAQTFSLSDIQVAEKNWRELQREDANNAKLTSWQNSILQRYLQLARNEADIHNFDQAQSILTLAQALDGQSFDYQTTASYVSQVQTQVENQDTIEAVANDDEPVSELARLVDLAQKAEDDGNYIEPEQQNAVYFYQQILKLEPDAPVAQKGLARIAEYYLEQARDSIRSQDFDSAQQHIDKAFQIAPSSSEIQNVRSQMTVALRSFKEQQHDLAEKQKAQDALNVQLSVLQQKASESLLSNRLTTPSNDSAYYYYSQMLKLDADNEIAITGMTEIVSRYLKLADSALKQEKYNDTDNYIAQAYAVKPDDSRIAVTRAKSIKEREAFLKRQLVANAKSLDKDKTEQGAKNEQLINSDVNTPADDNAQAKIDTSENATAVQPNSSEQKSDTNQESQPVDNNESVENAVAADTEKSTSAPSNESDVSTNAQAEYAEAVDEHTNKQEQEAVKEPPTKQEQATASLNAFRIKVLLQKAERWLKIDRLVLPPNNSAAFKFADVLKLDPNNEQAKIGLQKIVDRLNELADIAEQHNELQKAERMHIAAQKLSDKFTFLKNSHQHSGD